MKIGIYNVFELLALLVSLYTYRKNKGSFLQWMPLFMFFIVYAEMGAAYFADVLDKPNTHIYLWVNVFITFYYNYCFYSLFEKRKVLQYITMGSAALFVFLLLTIFFFMTEYSEYKNKLSMAFGIYISVIACIYLYQQFKEDDLEILLIKQPGFWIAAGLLIFYSGMSTVYALHPFTAQKNLFIFGIKLHQFFARVLSVFLYSCLSVAMILWKNKTKISSSQSL